MDDLAHIGNNGIEKKYVYTYRYITINNTILFRIMYDNFIENTKIFRRQLQYDNCNVTVWQHCSS